MTATIIVKSMVTKVVFDDFMTQMSMRLNSVALYNAVSKESPLLSEDEKQTATAMLSPESAGTVQPVSTSSKGNKDGNSRKRGRPKKNQLDLSLKKGPEVTTTKAKRRRCPGKNEPTVQYNAEKSPGSNVVIKKEEENLSADKSLLHQNEKLSKKTAKANCLSKESVGNKEVSCYYLFS